MKHLEDEFGTNAGKVWRAINKHGNIGETELRKTTRLNENKLNAAIGWLARENKIYKYDNLYAIGQTNLTDKIGTDAGKIWNTLSKRGNVDVSTIAKITKIQEKDAYYALGWLARESKIQTINPKNKDSQIKFRLK